MIWKKGTKNTDWEPGDIVYCIDNEDLSQHRQLMFSRPYIIMNVTANFIIVRDEFSGYCKERFITKQHYDKLQHNLDFNKKLGVVLE